MTRDTLVKWFVDNYPDHYFSMSSAYHEYSTEHMSPYHYEGSVWTHTMMVMTHISLQPSFDLRERTILLTVGLLHDIGKPEALEVIDPTDSRPFTRHTFKGHEGVSTHMSISILKHLQICFPDYYDHDTVDTIIRLISLHGVSLEESPDYLLALRTAFMDADRDGAIRITLDPKNDHYPPRKFLKHSTVDPDKHLIILVGLPCSGKSMYAQKNYPDHHIISRDDEVNSYYAHCNPGIRFTYDTAYTWIHNDPERLRAFNERFDRIVRSASTTHSKVVIDMTMTSLKARRRMLSNFPHHTKHAVVLFTSETSTHYRNNHRPGKTIPLHVFLNMQKSFTYPVHDEGFTTIQTIIT